jgi:basic membrane protein A
VLDEDVAATCGRLVTEERCDLIAAASFGFMDGMVECAAAHPGTKMLHISGYKTLDNLSTGFIRIYQARFLSGIVAGMMTTNNTIGYVAAFPIPEVVRGINAFTIGVRKVNPAARVKVIWTHTWFDPEAERRAALMLVNDFGVDLLTQHQDSTAVQEVALERNLFSIGYNSDMRLHVGDSVLTSAEFRWGLVYRHFVTQMLENRWTAHEQYWGSIRDSGVALSEFSWKVGRSVHERVNLERAVLLSEDSDSETIFCGPAASNVNATEGPVLAGPGDCLSDGQMLGMSHMVPGTEISARIFPLPKPSPSAAAAPVSIVSIVERDAGTDYLFLGGVSAAALVFVVIVLCVGCAVMRRRASHFAASAWKIDPSEVIIGQEIGRGGFGIVYEGMYRGMPVAIKRLPLTKIGVEASRKEMALGSGRLGSAAGGGLASNRQMWASRVAPDPSGGSGKAKVGGAGYRVAPMGTASNMILRSGQRNTRHQGAAASKREKSAVHLTSASMLTSSNGAGLIPRTGSTASLNTAATATAAAAAAAAKSTDSSLRAAFHREVATLVSVRHPNLVFMFGCFESEGGAFGNIVMGLEAMGSLYDVLGSSAVDLPWRQRVAMARDCAAGMACLHANDLVHRDLKSLNVLCDEQVTCKISDFGLSGARDQLRKNESRRAVPWLAPEIFGEDGRESLDASKDTPAADVYSFGVVMWELLTRKAPFEDLWETPREVGRRVRGGERLPIPEGSDPAYVALMKKCWAQNPRERPTFTEAVTELKTIHGNCTEEDDGAGAGRAHRGASLVQEDLLRALLPDHDQYFKYLAGERVESVAVDDMAVLFSDIASFTQLSATRPADQMAALLERLFEQYDVARARHKCHLVDTIGDAYIVAAFNSDDAPLRLARFAQEMLEISAKTLIDLDQADGEEEKSKTGTGTGTGTVKTRVGMHVGPVVATIPVMGRGKVNLTGDTMNLASRMESTGSPQRIQISEQAAQVLALGGFRVKKRGKVMVKGKGVLLTYWLHAEHAGSVQDDETPRPGAESASLAGDVGSQASAGSNAVATNIKTLRRLAEGSNWDKAKAVLEKLVAQVDARIAGEI